MNRKKGEMSSNDKTERHIYINRRQNANSAEKRRLVKIKLYRAFSGRKTSPVLHQSEYYITFSFRITEPFRFLWKPNTA